MRVIIEIEGGGADSPELVLRSSRAGTQTNRSSPGLTSAGADTVTGAIDAGPAPQAPQGGATSQGEGPVTTPATSPVFDQASSQSAGAAPGAPTDG